MTSGERYEYWCSRLDPADPLAQELAALRGNDPEINERFYQEIVFGTAGLRGICGAGTNRMNRLSVGRATQGIANYILHSGEDISRGVVIAYDCRHYSKEFSELAAEILAGNGIRSYLFPSLRPTPELSYALRKLHALSGINMTASHNPKEYNGYKVYWENGAQISGAVSDGMQAEIQKLDFFDEFRSLPLEEAKERGLIRMLGEEMDSDYLNYVVSMAQRPDGELDKTVPVVYTPLNGAGSIPLRKVAQMRGFTSFAIVPEQEMPDPDFTTVPYPNPENPQAFELAEKLGKELGADVLIATDPDSDRMAVELRMEDGGYYPLNGNQTGAMLIAYMAESQKAAGRLPENGAMIKSIVTGDFGRTVCEHYGITVYEALTGFKNICGRIPDLDRDGKVYFFGYEESIGCAPGEAVRDKDGICAGMLFIEMAAWCRKQGRTVMDYLQSLYREYGFFAEEQISVVLEGQAGAERIGRMMEAFRKNPPREFGGHPVAQVVDYQHGYEDIPASNVLKFLMEDGSWFAMRPSGTEPKIKFYYYAVAEDPSVSIGCVRELREAVDADLEAIE